MKRIRKFIVTVTMLDVVLQREMCGFHEIWKLAVEALQAGAIEVNLYDAIIQDARLVAVFCARNLREERNQLPHKSSAILWESQLLPQVLPNGQNGFVSFNRSDFAWCWVDGAKHDVPYRLNYLERKAEQNPDGPTAFGLGLIRELKDLMRK